MKNIFTSKTDLAKAYFPYIDERSARHKLMQVINDDEQLISRLRSSGYSMTSHLFTPAQVGMIMDRLGNPFKSN